MNNNEYIIKGGEEGKSRLNVLAEVMGPYTKTLLEQQGLGKGMALLDVGCGGGNVSLMAAQMVGARGRVTGVDFDEKILALARVDATESGMNNVSYRAISADELDYEGEFDIVYARFLLSHVRQPLDILKKMIGAAKPGSRVVVEDIYFSGHVCYPACTAFEQYVALFKKAAAHNGQNADIGPSLYSLMREAGLSEVGFDVVLPSYHSGPGKWMGWLTLDRIKESLISYGLSSEMVINEMLEELKVFTEDARSVMSLPGIFRAWGRKV